ncbi:MAG: diacylglycerol kinase family lipid kinase [Candidatus Heimdallarchaeota archaeon]|nr:diacylglycerol kinase family lipid kinase [Candidatus Heimdallarchaeota archaeon]
MRVKILYNPASRGGKSKKVITEIDEELKKTGIDFEIEETRGPKEGIKQAANAKNDGFDTVIACGGDGTAHEIANGAIQAGLTFGVLPIGSGNDFAAGIGINNWKEGIKTLVEAKTAKINVVESNDNHYSINVLDTGLSATVVKLSERYLKWISGSFRYTLLTFRALMKHKAQKVLLEVDGVEKEYQLNLVAMGCGQSFGSGMFILPNGRYNNDEMDIAVIHNAGRLRILSIFPKIFSGTHVKHKKYVTMLKGKYVKLTPLDANHDLLVEGEGEIFSKAPFEARLLPNTLEVIVPRTWKPENPSTKVKE